MHLITNKRIIAEIVSGEKAIMKIDGNMLYCEFGALDRGNITDVIDWGLYANHGSISFIDTIGYFNNEKVNSAEIKNFKVNFYLKKNVEKRISTFNIEKIDFDEQTKIVNAELVSGLLSVGAKKTNSPIYPFYPRNVEQLLSMFNDVFEFTNVSIGVDALKLSNTFIGCPYISIDTFWNVMLKLCQATMSRIVETPIGNFEITSSFPKREPIVVLPKSIISIENAGFVRIDNASIDVTKRSSFENHPLEGSERSFTVQRDENGVNIAAINGFSIKEINKSQSYNTYEEYVKGELRFKTPYKIFEIGADKSRIEHNLMTLDLSGNRQVTTNRNSSSETSICKDAVILDETEISAEILETRFTYLFTEPEEYSNQILTTGGRIIFPISTFVDSGTETISITSGTESLKIPSNDLIQENSYIEDFELGVGSKLGLGEYILQEVKRRYSHGIECFEIECLFNDYYYEDGSLAFSGSDLSNHFQKYDVIIPYVMKRGQVVPLRTNADGTPKKFRIIGISYSYDGLLKQKLQLHEERYDID